MAKSDLMYKEVLPPAAQRDLKIEIARLKVEIQLEAEIAAAQKAVSPKNLLGK